MKRAIVLSLLLLWNLSQAADLPELKVGGFTLGTQMWSFRLFTFAEGAFKAKEAGCSVIEAFPGQLLCPEQKVPFDHNASPEVWAHAKKILEHAGVRLVNYGVVNWKDEAEMERVFAFAKLMGIPAITIEPADPSPATFDAVEKMIKKYDIKVGIHNHPRQTNNPNYIYWDVEKTLKSVEGRDPRLGLACDTGHYLRSGVDPLASIQKAAGRIISVHLKDLDRAGDPQAGDVPFGTGVGKIGDILKELRRQGFKGNISIEYESDWENNVPPIRQCVLFVLKEARPF